MPTVKKKKNLEKPEGRVKSKTLSSACILPLPHFPSPEAPTGSGFLVYLSTDSYSVLMEIYGYTFLHSQVLLYFSTPFFSHLMH